MCITRTDIVSNRTTLHSALFPSPRFFLVLRHFACPSVHFEGMDGMAAEGAGRGGEEDREDRQK